MPELNCRKCRKLLLPGAALYLDSKNARTVTPICRDCHERLVSKACRASGYSPYRDSKQKAPGYQNRLYHGSYAEEF